MLDAQTVAEIAKAVAATQPSSIDLFGANIAVGSLGTMLLGAVALLGGWTAWSKHSREIKSEQATALAGELAPIKQAISTFKSKEALAEDRAALRGEIDDVRHSLKNERQRIDALDTKRQEADRWQAKVEITIQNFEKGQAEIKSEMKDGFAKLERLILNKGE